MTGIREFHNEYLHSHTSFLLSSLKLLSHVLLFVTLWTIAYQASLSMGFSRQEYWSGLPFPSPGDLSNPGIKSRFSGLEADTLTSESPGKPLAIHNLSAGVKLCLVADC